MEYLKVKNWEKYQHYQKENPPWIKLFHKLLDDYDYGKLPDVDKLLYVTFLMIAAKTNNKTPNDMDWIQKKGCLHFEPNINNLELLGFITVYSDSRETLELVYKESIDLIDSDREETETEKSKKPQPFRLPSPEEIENLTIPKVKETINAVCKELYERDVFSKANAFANKAMKSNSNARAVLHTLCRVFNAKPSEPWGYAIRILKVEDGNFCEKDFRKTT